jgi:hypothetical protein
MAIGHLRNAEPVAAPSAHPEPKLYLRCNGPGCTHPGFPMSQQEQWRRHVRACAKRNFGGIEEELANREKTYFTKSADPELYAHIRKEGS